MGQKQFRCFCIWPILSVFEDLSENDLLQSLLEVYPAKDAYSIIVIACLRVIRPSITCNRLQTHYDRTFTRIFYPDCSLSKNKVCDLLLADRAGWKQTVQLLQ